jgi:RNA 3'-terminal phosphate cyclase (ATP)
MGPRVSAELVRPGFFPAGGGKFTITIDPAPKLVRLDLGERGNLLRRTARATVARLPRKIAERELKVVRDRLGWGAECCSVQEADSSRGPGNILCIVIANENVTEVFTGFGEFGVSAEKVAEKAVREAEQYLAAGVPVGHYLADQLLLPMALAEGGSFRTLAPTRHMTTNIEVIRKFLPVEVSMLENGPNDWEIRVEKRE